MDHTVCTADRTTIQKQCLYLPLEGRGFGQSGAVRVRRSLEETFYIFPVLKGLPQDMKAALKGQNMGVFREQRSDFWGKQPRIAGVIGIPVLRKIGRKE